jgi:hypothetical protein
LCAFLPTENFFSQRVPALDQVEFYRELVSHDLVATAPLTLMYAHAALTYAGRAEFATEPVLFTALFFKPLAVSPHHVTHLAQFLSTKRFSLRSKTKVDAQWKLFCIVHNLLKIHRYGPGFA